MKLMSIIYSALNFAGFHSINNCRDTYKKLVTDKEDIETLFAETVDRIRKTGETDDYVRRTLADGTSQFWKNSGVKIDKGEVKDMKLNPPGGSETVAPKSPTVDQLMEKARGL